MVFAVHLLTTWGYYTMEWGLGVGFFGCRLLLAVCCLFLFFHFAFHEPELYGGSVAFH
jgi:hypothetical protein